MIACNESIDEYLLIECFSTYDVIVLIDWSLNKFSFFNKYDFSDKRLLFVIEYIST